MKKEMTLESWRAEGKKRFGDDEMKWKFVCPACGATMTTQDYKNAGAPETAVGFSCVGRWMPNKRSAFGAEGPGPCDYAGGGLIGINPITITDLGVDVFDFADTETQDQKPN